MNDDFMQLGFIKDFNEVCRLCLAQGGVLSRIFDPTNAGVPEEENLRCKIEKCVSLQVDENDGLPNLICEHCVLNVDRSLKFKERCIRSDVLLRSYLLSIAQKEKENSQPYIKTEIKSEPEEPDDPDMDALHDSIDEDDDELGHHQIKEEQSEEVVMIVDPFSIHLDQYDDDMSEENQDSQLDYSIESSYAGSDDLQLSHEDPRRHFNCNICNLGFKNREQLDRHKQIHTAGPPYPCDYCDESFDGRSDLKTHWETHKGDNRFMCEVCGASYAEEAILQAHSIIHERVRPYNCPTCSKSFYYRSDLRKHAIIHTDLSPSKSGNDLSSLLVAEPNGMTRKRIRNPEEWKRNKLRKARNEGKEYVDRNMKVHAAKKCEEFIHNCRFHCNQNVPESVRQQIFNEFWSLGDWNIQTSYLCQLVILDNVQRRKKTCPVYSKEVACKYFLNAKRVCKEFFRKTLDVSHKRISYLIKKKKASDSGVLAPDRRGRGKPANKIPDSKVDLIKEHIKLFPRYISDYSKYSNPRLKYLSQDLNVTKMYNLYVEYCKEKNAGEPVTETFYRNIFNAQLNLHLQRPLETCLICDKLELDIAYGSAMEMQQAIEQKEVHMQEMAVAKLDKDLTIRTTSLNHVVICFSLQKILPSPSPACNKAYYTRQLYMYNFCVHDLQSDDAVMYWWHEGLAGRETEQIVSCLYKFIQSLPLYVTHITVFSNSTLQTKSALLVQFWLYVTHNTQIKIVNHKFLPFEHATNECDGDFVTIDKWRRKTPAEINVPRQWINVISECSKKYSFVEMTSEDFVSLDCLKPYFKDSIPDINSMECFHLQQGSFTLFYKRAIADKDFRMIDMKSTEIAGVLERLPLLEKSSNKHKISFSKYRTLVGLLPYIPPEYHGFYLLLQHYDNDSSREKQLSVYDETKTSGFSFFYDTDEENT